MPSVHLVDRFAKSQRNLDCLRGLLRGCRLHGLCSFGIIEKLGRKYYERYGSFGYPRRLVDVTMHDSSKVRVIEAGDSPQYTTLSYCWGSNNQFSTTKDNLSQMEQGIDVSRLCPAIQDAVSITRSLYIRFLWVDALCIIQEGDGGKDWREQSQIMGLIYARSCATVAAASTDDCSKSFLGEPRKPAFVNTPFREKPQSPERGSLLFRLPKFDFSEDFEENVNGAALAKRAWVMQERMLSPRTIHFTSTQIYWECRSFYWKEDGEGITALGYDGSRQEKALLYSIFNALEINTAEEDSSSKKNSGNYLFLSTWSELVGEYSTMNLTYPSDRLPAIAGLARLASFVVPGVYLSGLWECDLASGLLWTAREYPIAFPSMKSAPSWTWASTVSPVDMCHRQLIDHCESRISFRRVSLGHDGMEVLEVEGKLHECFVSQQAEPQDRPRRPKEQMEYEFVSPSYKFWPVGLGEDSHHEPNICRFDGIRGIDTRFFFLPVACSDLQIHHCRGLLLEEDRSSLRGYKRCGIGWASHSAWHNVSPSLVQIA